MDFLGSDESDRDDSSEVFQVQEGEQEQAPEQPDDHSEETDEHSDEDGDSDESEESNQFGLVDLEASESDESADHSDDDWDSAWPDGTEFPDESTSPHFTEFHQFSRLPIELRHLIWEHSDPYLKVQQRVFYTNYTRRLTQTGQYIYAEFSDLWLLNQQTRPARNMLATCRESRQFALKHYPDAFPLEVTSRPAVVRFKRETDIVFVHDAQSMPDHLWDKLGAVLSDVHYLAFGRELAEPLEDVRSFSSFTSLRILYDAVEQQSVSTPHLRFIRDANVGKFHLAADEQLERDSFPIDYIFCWTNQEKGWSPANSAPLPTESDYGSEDGNQSEENNNEAPTEDPQTTPHVRPVIQPMGEPGVVVCPMAVFAFPQAIARYNDILSRKPEEFHLDFLADSDDSSSIGSYEDSGIDDSPINDYPSDNDTSSLLDIGVDIDNSEVDPSEEEALIRMSDMAMLGDMDDNAGAHFSSLEPDSAGPSPEHQNSENESEEEEEDQPIHIPRSKKRSTRRPISPGVDESDEEEEAEQSNRLQRGGSNRKRALVVDSDDDNDESSDASEEESRQPTAKRRRTVVDSDDDDDDKQSSDESQDEEIRRPAAKRRRTKATRVVDEDDEDEEVEADQDDEEDEEEEDDDESEDEGPKKPMSLAERLNLFRSENPVQGDADEEDSGTERGSPGAALMESYMDNYSDDDEEGGEDYYGGDGGGDPMDDSLMLDEGDYGGGFGDDYESDN